MSRISFHVALWSVAALLVFAASAAPERGHLQFVAEQAQREDARQPDPARGRAAFIALQCHACHRVAEDPTLPTFAGAWEGPLLHGYSRYTDDEVAWLIVEKTWLAPEELYEVPMVECASNMTEQQLLEIVAYLRNPSAAARPQT